MEERAAAPGRSDAAAVNDAQGGIAELERIGSNGSTAAASPVRLETREAAAVWLPGWGTERVTSTDVGLPGRLAAVDASPAGGAEVDSSAVLTVEAEPVTRRPPNGEPQDAQRHQAKRCHPASSSRTIGGPRHTFAR
jgi:hypothetical protein